MELQNQIQGICRWDPWAKYWLYMKDYEGSSRIYIASNHFKTVSPNSKLNKICHKEDCWHRHQCHPVSSSVQLPASASTAVGRTKFWAVAKAWRKLGMQITDRDTKNEHQHQEFIYSYFPRICTWGLTYYTYYTLWLYIIYIYPGSSISTFFCSKQFLLTRTWKRASESWRTGIYAGCPGQYAHIFCLKMHKVQKCQKWWNYAHVEKNRSKSKSLSNSCASICAFSRMQMQVCMYQWLPM